MMLQSYMEKKGCTTICYDIRYSQIIDKQQIAI